MKNNYPSNKPIRGFCFIFFQYNYISLDLDMYSLRPLYISVLSIILHDILQGNLCIWTMHTTLAHSYQVSRPMQKSEYKSALSHF
jgi:hypothetical protein